MESQCRGNRRIERRTGHEPLEGMLSAIARQGSSDGGTGNWQGAALGDASAESSTALDDGLHHFSELLKLGWDGGFACQLLVGPGIDDGGDIGLKCLAGAVSHRSVPHVLHVFGSLRAFLECRMSHRRLVVIILALL